jgi:ribosomal protein S5
VAAGPVVRVPAGDGFTTRERGEVQRALQYAGEASGLKFAVVVREVGGPLRPYAESVQAAMEDPPRSVLVVVDPVARGLEIVTGARARRRIDDASCDSVAAAIVRATGEGGVSRGLVMGLQQLGQIAGPPQRRRTGPPVTG